MNNKDLPMRAKTTDQKREVINRLFSFWCAFPDLRLGQLIDNSLNVSTHKDLFCIEDYQLVLDIEYYAKHYS